MSDQRTVAAGLLVDRGEPAVRRDPDAAPPLDGLDQDEADVVLRTARPTSSGSQPNGTAWTSGWVMARKGSVNAALYCCSGTVPSDRPW